MTNKELQEELKKFPDYMEVTAKINKSEIDLIDFIELEKIKGVTAILLTNKKKR